MESVQVEVNASDVNERHSLMYIDEDTTSQQCLDVSTNNELPIVANNVCVEKDSARDRQGENIIVQYSVSDEQILLLKTDEDIVIVEQASEHQVTKELFCYGRVLKFITNITKEQANGYSQLSRVTACCLLLITIILSVLDVGTDIWLMYQYFISGQNLYGALTLVFVWGPALFSTGLLYRLLDEYETKNTLLYQLEKKKWLLIIIYIVPIASAVVALNNLILLLKNKANKEDSQENTVILYILQYLDSYLEALPQLTLQLTIILNNIENEIQDTSFLNMLRWCSMALSLVTVARVIYSIATNELGYTGVKEAVILFIRTLLLLVSRVLVVSMGFAVSPIAAYLLLFWPLTVVVICYVEDGGIIGSIVFGMIAAPFCIFFDFVSSFKLVDYQKPYVYMILYAFYTLECVLNTVLWCEFNISAAHGTVWYYTVPGLAVLLYILYIPFVLFHRHIVNKREADYQTKL